MIIEQDLTNLGEIAKAVSKWVEDSIFEVREYLLKPNSYILSSIDKSIYLLIDGKSSRVADTHMYCSRSSRGKAMIQFVDEAREWIKSLSWFFPSSPHQLRHLFRAIPALALLHRGRTDLRDANRIVPHRVKRSIIVIEERREKGPFKHLSQLYYPNYSSWSVLRSDLPRIVVFGQCYSWK